MKTFRELVEVDKFQKVQNEASKILSKLKPKDKLGIVYLDSARGYDKGSYISIAVSIYSTYKIDWDETDSGEPMRSMEDYRDYVEKALDKPLNKITKVYIDVGISLRGYGGKDPFWKS